MTTAPASSRHAAARHASAPPLAAAVLLGLALAAPTSAAAQGCPDGMRPLHAGRFPLASGSGVGEVGEYCLDATEVSADDWAGCVRKGRCSDAGLYCSKAATYGVKGRGDHPINCVAWTEADAYCKALGKRLPTEAEWEWAARGALRGWKFPWGVAAPGARACWDGPGNALGKGGRTGTCATGSIPLGDNPDGVHDLAGNVREWTSSADGRLKVVRGGSWGDSLPDFLAAGFRGMNAPDERFEITGFRCAAPVDPARARAAAAAPAEPEAEDDDGIVRAPADDPAPPPAPKPAPPKPADDWKPSNTIQVDGLQLELKPGR